MSTKNEVDRFNMFRDILHTDRHTHTHRQSESNLIEKKLRHAKHAWGLTIMCLGNNYRFLRDGTMHIES